MAVTLQEKRICHKLQIYRSSLHMQWVPNVWRMLSERRIWIETSNSLSNGESSGNPSSLIYWKHREHKNNTNTHGMNQWERSTNQAPEAFIPSLWLHSIMSYSNQTAASNWTQCQLYTRHDCCMLGFQTLWCCTVCRYIWLCRHLRAVLLLYLSNVRYYVLLHPQIRLNL